MGSTKEQRYAPLLGGEDGELTEGYEPRSQRRWRNAFIALLSYACFVTGILAYLGAQSLHMRAPYSPVGHIVRHQNKPAMPNPHSILSSEPSVEMEKEWEKLLYPAYIYATEEEIRRQGDDPHTSVKLAEGNYLGVLGVYHQLHCLRWLYFLAHEEIYWTNMTAVERGFRRDHGRHCIQILIDYIKCKPDTAVYTLQFNATTDIIPKFKSGPSWQCVNWDAVQGWAEDRARGYDPPLLAPDSYFDDILRSDGEKTVW